MNKIWPTFFIIGAGKAGTTSLYNYMKQHPQVFMSPMKEPHFFSQIGLSLAQRHLVPSVTDLSEYLNLFKNSQGFQARGEASVSYLESTDAAYRIHEMLPEARIIVLLRDPIERAFSHYLMNVREGKEHLHFYEALVKDFTRKEKCLGISHSYVESGLYYQHLKLYLSIFSSEKILVLMFEDLVHDSKKVLLKVCEFLNIDPESIKSIDCETVHNPYRAIRNEMALHVIRKYQYVRRFSKCIFPASLRTYVKTRLLQKKSDKPSLDRKSIDFLREIYDPEIKALEKLTGQNFDLLRKYY